MLLGRERESAQLYDLISRVRGGASAAMVVAGEAGIGKTSLLEHAVTQAGGLRVLWAQGVESEQNLPFAGLAELMGPILGHLDALPGPQRAALAAALAVGPAVQADRFAICSATLSLLGVAAAERPVLAVVDDAHWLDPASAQAIEFTARRLREEPVGLVVAVRHGAPSSFDPARIESISIPGLHPAAARELLARTGRPIAPPVAEQLVNGMGGNPLALLELVATLTERELSGLASLSDPLPVAAALRHAFAHRLDTIDPASRQLLLLAAADATADLATLQRASELLSLDLAGLAAAEQAGLIRVAAARVEFTHPLLRSTAYHTARPEDRRAAHRALAEGIDPHRDPIRRAWHLAATTIGPDEGVAASLDQAASVALARNAFVAASRASQRAAELTADPGQQVHRWMAAGQAAHLGGDVASAARLLSRAADLAADPCIRADAQVLRAHASQWTSAPAGHYHQLVTEAEAVLPFDRQRAANLLAMATGACFMSGQLNQALRTAARAVGLCRPADGMTWLVSQGWLASASILTGSRAEGRLVIRDIVAHPEFAGPGAALRLLRMLCGQALIWCEDYEPASEILAFSVNSGRALGLLADLSYGLAVLSELRFRMSSWGQAHSDATEAAELGGDFATTSDLCYALVCAARVEAAMGAAAACRAHLERALDLARPAGIEPIPAYAAAAAGLLELGIGNYQQAAAELARASSLVARHGLKDPAVIQWRPDYIESLTRIGRTADAREELAVLDAEAAATGSRWAEVTGARCRGLVQTTPQQSIAEFGQAVAMAETSANAFEQARARLCLGEALRRARRRGEARPQLQQAHRAFELLGARPWAERAATELSATGITATPRRKPVHVQLTPQELRVALQVAEGLTNQEVAARLFLSPKTIEVHLGHIYHKLGLHSRTSLTRLVSSGLVSQQKEFPNVIDN